MENECEAFPGVAYPGVRDNRSTLNTKTGYDDDDDDRTRRNSLSIVSDVIIVCLLGLHSDPVSHLTNLNSLRANVLTPATHNLKITALDIVLHLVIVKFLH